MMNQLEFPYQLKGRHAIALMATFPVLPGFAFWLASTDGTSPAKLVDEILSVHYGFFALLIPVMWLGVPLAWLGTRGGVLRLTDSELSVGKLVLPVHEVDSIRLINQGLTRSMIVQAGKRKAAINQMCLPSPKAFDEILQALTNRQSMPQKSSNAGPRGRSAGCEAIRQKLRLTVMYDEAKIDRLVAAERDRQPGATDEQLHAAAYERWCRDNRS